MQAPHSATGRLLPLRVAAVFAAVLALFMTATVAFAAAPTVTTLSSTSGPTAGGNSVTITGTGFTGVTGAAGVTFGGTDATSYTVVSNTEISAVAPPHAAGLVSVVVTHPSDGASVATNNYTYVAAPTVTALSPVVGPTTGATAVTITGTNLTGATAVTFGGVAATTFTVDSATQITATAPAHAGGSVFVVVTTPGGMTATNGASTYLYAVATAAPTVTSVAPVSGSTTGGTPVVITGTDFTNATSVTFGGTNATSYVVTSSTRIDAIAPAHTAGQVFVTVTTAAGDSGTPAGSVYTYVTGTAPTVTNVAPVSGPAGGGTSVVITGTGFTGATGVSFGGTNATTFTVNSDTQITAVAPAHAAGAINVVVTTPAGSSPISGASVYTYTVAGAPVVSGVNPAAGPIVGGTTVTLTGTGFTGATSVTFGGVAAPFTLTSDTSITATSPAHAAGPVNVVVTTALGTSVATAANTFTYGATVPVVTNVSPSSGALAGGTVVTITGTGFTGATSVTFDGIAGTSLTVNGDTSITVTSPAHAAGAVDVRVVGPAGTSAVAAAAKFNYSGGTVVYNLSFRWSLIVWEGQNGISAANALKGLETPDNAQTNNIYSQVTAMYRWNGAGQKWEGFFPGSEDVFGANDFTTLTEGTAYWIAISAQNGLTWTVLD